ncbi:DUF3320 domain-containing protein [Tomitella biformata]|uniref:DUF3320 domain-containing protein n=1 Tax=Tomitella biformata TaxID=630403 RepID=UPI0004639EEB|nr:DUF3320 domain-containing protein [Tomitella biformata]
MAQNTGVGTGAGALTVDQRLNRQLVSWREQLLALDRRQRLLYFKHTKASSLELSEIGSAEILSLVQQGEVPVRPKPDDGEAAVPRSITAENKTAATLKSSLNRMSVVSQQSFADRGVWTLQLGLGMLRWIDPDDGAEVHSPLLMVPVELKKTGADSPYVLFLADGDASVNPALKLKLEEFALTLPEVDPDTADITSLMADVAVLVEGRAGWEVVDRAVCTTFTFHKEAMYRDLLANADAVAGHPLVELLAVGPESSSADSFAFDPFPIDYLDSVHPPEKMYSILDADSSQRRCILAAAQGQSFVMDGPPGTGKSQTIANTIAELISTGKTVLFVSEKAAALDVVRDRLGNAGLSHFLLELHSHAATRKHVVQELAKTLQNRVVTRQKFTGDETNRLAQTREELNNFAAGMNEVHRDLGMTIFEAIGLLEQLPEHIDASADHGSDWAMMTRQRLANLRDQAAELGTLWHVAETGDDFLWRGLVRQDRGAPEARELKRKAASGVQQGERLAMRLDSIDTAIGMRFSRDTAGVQVRTQVLNLLADRRDVPTDWFCRSSLESVGDRLEAARTAAEIVESQLAHLNELAGPKWTELDAAVIDPLQSGVEDKIVRPVTLLSEIDSLVPQLAAFRDLTVEVLADTETLASMLGIQTKAIMAERAAELVELAALGGAVERPDPRWFNAGLQEQVARAITVLESLVAHAERRQKAMSEVFTLDALDLDLHALMVRFRDVHKGMAKLSSAARGDKKLLKSVTVTRKVNRDLISQLGEAASWQQAVTDLRKAEALHGTQLGSQYRGVETDFAHMRAALDNARRAVGLAGIGVDTPQLTRQLASTGVPDPELLLIAGRLRGLMDRWTVEVAALPKSVEMTAGGSSLGVLIRDASWRIDRLTEVQSLLQSVAYVLGRDVAVDDAISITMKTVRIAGSLAELEGGQTADRQLFGGAVLDRTTDFDLLSKNLKWVESIREAIGSRIPTTVAEALPSVTVEASDLTDVSDQWDRTVRGILDQFTGDRQWELREDLLGDLDGARDLLREMEETAVPDIENWCRYIQLREWASSNGFKTVLADLGKKPRTAAVVAQSIEYAALEAWVDGAVRDDPRLVNSHAQARDNAVARFKELDQSLVDDAHSRVIERCNDRAPSSLTSRPAQVIIREAEKKTRHKPIRTLLQETGSLAQELKPCFMMSPLSVSQYLPPTVKFDVVIFDEASQVLPSDAINCVYRANQLIVAGDQKQLPPTDFFSAGDDSEDEDDEVDVFQSVLDLAKGAGGLTSLPLNWHYRSRHEDLITYSNYRFYDGKLFTFPSAVYEASDLGVKLFTVDGVYKRGGTRDNPIEAAKVVERVLYFATNHPELSIGVVTFSTAQADAVMAEMERQSGEHPQLAAMLGDYDRLDGFFVKSLENVQGDERDVIIFSIGYGPDENGKLYMNFGPLGKDGGWRRLNVAITRARSRVEVVSSFHAGQMSPGANEGLRHLQNYLDFAERGQAALALDMADSLGDVESPFEEQVIAVIRGWGYDVVPQVGVAGYRIDMAVRHPDRPGTYVIGIECDGAAYHSSKTARDRDRLRESVLRNLGWEIHRIWGLSWWRDRVTQEQRLRAAIEDAIAASDEPRKPSPAREIVTPVIEVEELDFDAKPEWAVEYTMADEPMGGRRDPKTLEGQMDLRRYFLQVIEAEAPVHYDLLVERFKQAWGTQRFGAAIKRSVDEGLSALRSNGHAITRDRDDVFRLPGSPAPFVRIPVDGEPKRKLAHVPAEELDLAVMCLVKDAHTLDIEILAQQVSRLFGWSKATQEVKGITEAAVERLVRLGDLDRSATGDLSVVYE